MANCLHLQRFKLILLCMFALCKVIHSSAQHNRVVNWPNSHVIIITKSMKATLYTGHLISVYSWFNTAGPSFALLLHETHHETGRWWYKATWYTTHSFSLTLCRRASRKMKCSYCPPHSKKSDRCFQTTNIHILHTRHSRPIILDDI